MSAYSFLPPRPRANASTPFVTWGDAFSEDELEKLAAICDLLPLEAAKIGSGADAEIVPCIRSTRVSWLKNNEDTAWVYDRLAWVARSINSDFYRFNLFGFLEDMQFTVYTEEEGGHYSWHLDTGGNHDLYRKLSLVLQLSDPDDYEGGDLQVFTSSEPTSIDKKKGLIAAFPSYTLHKVTPVTKGIRKTLVIWVAGPEFV